MWPAVDDAPPGVVDLSGGAAAPYLGSYRALRAREGWSDDDVTVAMLPDVPAGHPHERIWLSRAASAQRFLGALPKVPGQQVFDFACGNGWLSRMIAGRLPGARVYGVDLDDEALATGARVFGHTAGLRFVRADLFETDIPTGTFDMVVAAAVLPYFADLSAVLDRLLELLKPGGELHILDTPFYRGAERGLAVERARAHFDELGCGDMAAHHHPHSLDELERFGARFAYRPGRRARAKARLLRRAYEPFPWVVISRQARD